VIIQWSMGDGGVWWRAPGVTVRVAADARLELANDTGRDLLVLGYDGEPYLKVGAGRGVREPPLTRRVAQRAQGRR